MTTIEVGDKVHARLYNAETGTAAVQEFVVVSIEGALYFGGAITCDTSAGWTVEVIEKGLSNLNLPTALSEITAYGLYDNSTRLMGKGENWVTLDGQSYPVRQIFRWVPGHV